MSKPETKPIKRETNSSKLESEADRRDVVIYELETRKVVSVVGRDMPAEGFHSYHKRVETALERCDDRYSAEAVPVGKYKPGDIIDEADLD